MFHIRGAALAPKSGSNARAAMLKVCMMKTVLTSELGSSDDRNRASIAGDAADFKHFCGSDRPIHLAWTEAESSLRSEDMDRSFRNLEGYCRTGRVSPNACDGTTGLITCFCKPIGQSRHVYLSISIYRHMFDTLDRLSSMNYMINGVWRVAQLR
jgi:hypothetical protein